MNLKVEDKVRLDVDLYVDRIEGDQVTCVWHEIIQGERQLRRHIFSAGALKKVGDGTIPTRWS